MATISAFGFGGTDHLNTLFEGFANEYFARRAADYSLQNQMEYDLWSARKLYPAQLSSQLDNYGMERQLSALRTGDNIKNVRFGLEAAGYNPLLAVDGGFGSGGGSGPILSMPSGRVAPTSSNGVSSGGASASGNPYMIASAKQQLENQRNQGRILAADAALAESDTALEILRNKAEISALEGDHRSAPYDEEVSVMTHEGWKQLRDNVMEKLRKQGYTESEARARTLDVLHETERVVDTAAGAATSASALKRAFRPRMSNRYP